MNNLLEIPGYPNYLAHISGRIWSKKRNKWLSIQPQTGGYLQVSLRINKVKKTASVHRLIGLAFHPNPSNYPQINHKNGIKIDNRPQNLEWCTAKQNTQHAELNGFRSHNDSGENNTRALLSNKQATKIRNLVDKGIKQYEIAKMFGISQPLVSLIKNQKHYAKSRVYN